MAACVTLDLDEIAEAKILDASGVDRFHRHHDVVSPRPTAAREAGLAGAYLVQYSADLCPEDEAIAGPVTPALSRRPHARSREAAQTASSSPGLRHNRQSREQCRYALR